MANLEKTYPTPKRQHRLGSQRMDRRFINGALFPSVIMGLVVLVLLMRART